MKTGAEVFVDSIVGLGARNLFTLVGDHLNEVLRIAADRGLRILDMRHESAVVHAADAWARITRRPAVALVTGGPGHTNSLTGLATAFLAGSPVISVSGSRPAALAGRGAFQELEQLATAKPIVKWAAEPTSSDEIPSFVQRAWTEALSGRMGPVHLTIPLDLFTGTAADITGQRQINHVSFPPSHHADIERAIHLLRGAQRPVIIAGSGVWWSNAERELTEFAEKTGIPVYTIGLARGAMADSHPLCLGYADPALNRGAAKAFCLADLFLIFGKRIDFRLSLGSPRVIPSAAKVIQVDIHPGELGLNRHLDVAICADVRTTLQSLLAEAVELNWPELPWIEETRRMRVQWQSKLQAAAEDKGQPIHPAALFREISQSLPPETLYSWDGGDFAHWGRAILPANIPGGWLRLGPLGTIGAALPNALALQLANPEKPVVLFTGDGALGFYIAELDTAVRHNLPIIIIVGNDAGWGIERELQGGRNTVACELRPTRYDIVMQGFGGAGEHVEHLDQVKPALSRALASGRPYMINVTIRGARSPFTDWKLQSA